MTTWVVIALAVAAVAYVLSRGKPAPRAAPAGTPRAAASGQAPDLGGGLKAMLFAEQPLEDELASLAPYSPEVKDALALLEKGDCEGAKARLKEKAPTEYPWSLLLAHVRASCGDRAGAIELLTAHLAATKEQAHPTLQTWGWLRKLGAEPEAEAASQVLGLVVEIGYAEGADTVAAYADGSSRLFGRQGGASLGQEKRPAVQEAARRAIGVAASLAASAKPVTARAPVDPGVVRFTFLTPGGPLVSECNSDDLKAGTSPLLPLFTAAAELERLKAQG